MCICVNSPNEHNFTKRILPPHSTHPLSNKLTNTHSFLFGNVSRGQDFYEFLFFLFFISIVKAPTSQTTLSSNYTLQYIHLLFRIPYLYKCHSYRNTFEWNLHHYAFKIHPWYFTQRGCIGLQLLYEQHRATKKKSKKETETRKKMGFFGWWALNV